MMGQGNGDTRRAIDKVLQGRQGEENMFFTPHKPSECSNASLYKVRTGARGTSSVKNDAIWASNTTAAQIQSNNVHIQFTGLVYLFSYSSSCNVSACWLYVEGPNVIMSCGSCCHLLVQYNYRRCSKIVYLCHVLLQKNWLVLWSNLFCVV